ncbi:MAG: metallophosphoesterase [Deltaproteobacteria bacterium]|nr:metallophosphoesterase [Deltaproteobacteria bacterium]
MSLHELSLARGVAVATLAIVGCRREPPPQTAPASALDGPHDTAAPAPAPRKPDCALAEIPLRRPAPARLVAIGDVHGDLAATRDALRIAGAIDDKDHWIGGALVVVQTGDVLDRGNDERAILDLIARLEGEAAAAGGALVFLLGNHELMNGAGDFRYVTPGGFADFVDVPGLDLTSRDVAALPAAARPRAAALFPGGRYAKQLAGHDVAMVIGDTLFVHGGVIPTWATHLEEANRAARCWLDGHGPLPDVLTADDGPVWSRVYGGEDVDCADLSRALAAVGATRMVVGHTVQPAGISSACDGKVWRIDVGLAAYYGGPHQVLEIAHGADGDRVRPLGAPGAVREP